jgi:hypothetical protein
MKFYKQLRLNKNAAKSLEFTYTEEYDGTFVMDVPWTPPSNDENAVRPFNLPVLKAIRIPTGPSVDRPDADKYYSSNGLLRFNTDEDALEVLTNGVWIQLKAKVPASITIQRFGVNPATTPPGRFPDGIETYAPYEGDEESELELEADGGTYNTISYVDGTEINFGPIKDNKGVFPKSAANIFVYVENVFQIPYTNYVLKPAGELGNLKPWPDGFYIQFETPPPPGKTVTVIHGFD